MRIHGLSPALNYGQQALEGFKAFRTPSGISLFRADRNALRLQHSAAVLSMPPVPTDLFMQACRAAVALNARYVPPHGSGGALYVRPLLLGTSGLLPPVAANEYTFCVHVAPTPAGVHDGTAPVKALILDDFDRAAPKGTGHAKVGGNYAPVLRWCTKAKAEGFGITLHLDSARHEEVDEFSTCAFIGVHYHPDTSAYGKPHDVTLVVPDSPCVIDSVTCDSVQHIARNMGWKVEKRAIHYTELPAFSEVLGAGTGVSLTPIRSITRRVTGRRLPPSRRVLLNETDKSESVQYIADGESSGGLVFLSLLAQLRAIQLGNVRDDFGWRFAVRSEDGLL